ncbi:amino acid adenylation domain-containing protein [Streptomyces sp. ALI-76-A]|uniref:non-ribosomal peptide synthetase n=1 Tax=Streptomyces sp. ALI-76-A TaxID=3025736 RepID=UPI00256F3BD7|nr:amino acid adenylation domain-containing protein [Streptomyces sp. ALI-76-A]MDL5205474.1 amino acid adenylation domain-containing protein [Streptomyces sp. ALI-76-A]
MWRAQEMAPDTPNHALTMWDVDGALDAAVMESAFLHVMGEAEVLRVNFVDDGGGLRLVPRELGDWRPFFLDLSTETDPEQAAREALAELVRRPFDLGRDLLFRLGVVRLAENRSLLVIAYHHLVSDGFGAGGLLSRRLAEVYTALARGERVPELPHPWDTASFAIEAVEYLASQKFAEDMEFWGDYLKDAPPPAQVPRVTLSEARRTALSEPLSSADRWSEVAETIGMVSRTLTVPRAEADRWTETAQSMGVWMSQMLTAAAAVYFRHRCDRPEFLLSLAVGNRVGVASRTPGLAVNVVPVRVRIPLGATFTEIAETLVDETYEIFDHTACHYSDIQRAGGTVLSGRGSFGAVVNVVEFAEQLHFGDSPARYSGATTGTFEELSIGVYTDGSPDSDLFIRLDAPAGLYHRAELRFIGEELIAFIRAALDAGTRPVGALDVVGGDERDRVLAAPDTADAPLPGLTVPELFARQVERDPYAVALTAGDTSVSYRELDERSGRLAAALRRRDVGPETVVAVALPRSVDLAVALLAVAKAGGAALPLDPASPASLAGRTGKLPVRALLTDAATAATVPTGPDVPTLLLDDLADDTGGTDGTGTEAVPPHPDNLLAVLHGTGPAGEPVPVAVTHRNIERFVLDRRCRDAGRGTVLWHAPHTCDALALEVWTPLLNGGRVVVAPEGDLDTDALAGLRAAHDITTVWLPAGRFVAIAAAHPERLAGLREVWTGGDRVSPAALRRVREACPELTVVTGHGPAETTVLAACHRLPAGEPVRHVAAVGRPVDHTALYVLGPGLAPVPVDVAGELYVSGPGVARGYPGRPAATAERFVPCPFGPAGTVMYRTGDRVRWTADGRLAHVGRADTQADVRGVRVELAEVEEALSEHAGLAQAVVAVREDGSGQQRLVAYVVPVAGTTVSADELRRFAAGWLPESMVPSVFTVLDRLPLTAGGRVDRAALPRPAFDDERYRAPRNDTERILAKAFAEVLELDRVGIDEDFFDLGGNSLRAIRLVGLIRAELNQEVSIRRLFAARTVLGLSDMWKDLGRSSRPTLRRRTREGAVL